MFRPGVETKDAGDHILKAARNEDLTLPATIAAARVVVHMQVRMEGIQHVAQPAAENQRSFGCTAMGYEQVMFLGVLLDGVQVFCPRAVSFDEFVSRQVSALA